MIVPTDSQRSDFRWYTVHLQELYNQYGRCFVSIRNKTVLGVYNSFGDAVRSTSAYNLPGTFIVQELSPDESCYTKRIYNMLPCM